ncbi:MAG: 50S ribosomal protein L18 [Candidatus Thermoplasmatota archaeon]|nr:50S ribosomal protein L18 [Candidatus Thermoplasmatota archaeon]MDP7264523.1 50S ribosomal protein L18 [Candidatus Thermoplasmatota archaeon]
MKKKKNITRVPFRRRREGKTDYRKRLALLKSGKHRLVVRKTLTKTIVQVIEYNPLGDLVRAAALSTELSSRGWTHSFSNTPAAYLTGLLAGKRALKKGISEAVLDMGLSVPVKGSKSFAVLKGVLDAGVEIPHGEKILPSGDALKGAFISNEIAADFDKTKERILERG